MTCTQKDSPKSKISGFTGRMLFCFIALLTAGVELFCFSEGISGNDFWWHVKVGEWICENRRVPATDIFSWLGQELEISWTAHEWLSDVIFYGIFHLSGEVGIYLFSVAAALLMTFLLMWQTRNRIKENFLISGIFFVLFGIVASGFFYGRPHVFGFFLLFFELKILYRFMEKPDTKAIWLLPVIGCLWSNLHGGSSNLSYLLCLAFFVLSFFRIRFGRVISERLERNARIKLGAVTLGTLLALLINPIGVRAVLYPYQSFADTLMMSVISEWQAPDAKAVGEIILFFLPILLMTVGFFTEDRKVRLTDLVVMAVFFYLFFRSVRFIMLWYIAACFYAFPYLPKCVVSETKKIYEKAILGGCTLLLMIPIGVSVRDMVLLGRAGSYIGRVMSDEAVSAVKSANPQRIFNDYNLGEALIYNDIPVFFDARADLYAQEHIMEDGISLMNLVQFNSEAKSDYVDVEALIGQYDFDGILILKSRSLYAWLIAQEERYVCTYEDDSVAYFSVSE